MIILPVLVLSELRWPNVRVLVRKGTFVVWIVSLVRTPVHVQVQNETINETERKERNAFNFTSIKFHWVFHQKLLIRTLINENRGLDDAYKSKRTFDSDDERRETQTFVYVRHLVSMFVNKQMNVDGNATASDDFCTRFIHCRQNENVEIKLQSSTTTTTAKKARKKMCTRRAIVAHSANKPCTIGNENETEGIKNGRRKRKATRTVEPLTSFGLTIVAKTMQIFTKILKHFFFLFRFWGVSFCLRDDSDAVETRHIKTTSSAPFKCNQIDICGSFERFDSRPVNRIRKSMQSVFTSHRWLDLPINIDTLFAVAIFSTIFR